MFSLLCCETLGLQALAMEGWSFTRRKYYFLGLLMLLSSVTNVTGQPDHQSYTDLMTQFSKLMQNKNIHDKLEHFLERLFSDLSSDEFSKIFANPNIHDKPQLRMAPLGTSSNSTNVTGNVKNDNSNVAHGVNNIPVNNSAQKPSGGQDVFKPLQQFAAEVWKQLQPKLFTIIPQLSNILGPDIIGQIFQGKLTPAQLPQLLQKLTPQKMRQLFQLFGQIVPDLSSQLPLLLENLPKDLVKQLPQPVQQLLPQIPALLGIVKANGTVNNSTSPLGFQNILSRLPDLAKLLGSMAPVNSSVYPISNSCAADLDLLRNGLMSQQQWALRMIDALGKPPAGILEGNLVWSGSYDECKRIDSDTGSPFNGKYCHFKLILPLSGDLAILNVLHPGGIDVGNCLPQSCTNEDMQSIWNSVLNPLKVYMYGTGCQEEKEYDTKAIVVLCVCGFFVALMIFATIFDVFFVECERKKMQNCDLNVVNYKKTEIETVNVNKLEANGFDTQMDGTVNNGYVHDAETGVLPNGDGVSHNVQKETKLSTSLNDFKYHAMADNVPGIAPQPKSTEYNPGLVAKLIISFSVYSNGRKLLNAKKTSGTLGAVNGIRFISMSWVILGHSLAFTLPSMNNMGYIYPTWLSRWTFMAIANALLSVDTFFVLSGLLLAYLFMKEMKREKGRVNWFMFYFHRFWRLTPPYMLVIMVNVTLSRYFGDGPGYPKDGLEQDYCRNSWWKNLIYINNFFFGDSDGSCLGWSWYLANDMQFYVISPLMLVPLYFSDKIGKTVVAVFMIGFTTAAIAVSAVLELPPTMISLVPDSNTGDYFNYYYVRPYCRMGPYIAGLFTGYCLYKTNCKVKMNRVVTLFGWLIAFVFACMALYGVLEEAKGNHMSVAIAAIYNGTSRTVWGICVCWVVFACCTGHGGFINEFLSWEAFIPLGRLTYCAYLVHPIVIYVYNDSLRETFHGSEIAFTYIYLASLVFSYGCAFVTSLAFESPMMGLERAIFKRGKK